MLEDYAKIQPAVQKDIKDAIDARLRVTQKDDQYQISQIQSHQHTGIDSLQIPFTSIIDSSNYRVFQRTTLTAAQVKDLFDTPVVIVPALGTSAIIIVEGITAFLDYNTATYVSANDLEFRYTDSSGAKVANDIPNGFIQATADEYRQSLGDTGYIALPNAPVVVWVPVANPTTGDSPITFLVAYRVVSFQN